MQFTEMAAWLVVELLFVAWLLAAALACSASVAADGSLTFSNATAAAAPKTPISLRKSLRSLRPAAGADWGASLPVAPGLGAGNIFRAVLIIQRQWAASLTNTSARVTIDVLI